MLANHFAALEQVRFAGQVLGQLGREEFDRRRERWLEDEPAVLLDENCRWRNHRGNQ